MCAKLRNNYNNRFSLFFFFEFAHNHFHFEALFALKLAELFAYFSGKGYLCTKIDDEQMDCGGSDPADECRHVGTDESGCNSIG